MEEGGRNGRFWREMKVGVLQSVASETHATDPCPTIPEVFVDPQRIQRLCREIKGGAKGAKAGVPRLTVPETESISPVASSTEASLDEQSKRPGLPVPLVRSVVATRRDLDAFGWILATAAWTRGFAAAMRKAFLGDGSENNWTVWRKHFSDYVPILDFVHALCYVYAAAIAGRTVTAGWSDYCTWAQWLWVERRGSEGNSGLGTTSTGNRQSRRY